jgi:hypothetical protein
MYVQPFRMYTWRAYVGFYKQVDFQSNNLRQSPPYNSTNSNTLKHIK